MQLSVRLSDLDSRAWSTATWASPFTTQLVLAGLIAISWLFGKAPTALHGFASFLAGAATTFLLCLVATVLLFSSSSSRARGIGISILGSFVIVLIGGIVYGFWIIQWQKT